LRAGENHLRSVTPGQLAASRIIACQRRGDSIDWILKEGTDGLIRFDRDDDSLFTRTAVSLMDAVRGYVAGTRGNLVAAAELLD
jgi:hypothetical protein